MRRLPGVLLAFRDAGKTECGPDPRPGRHQGLQPSQRPPALPAPLPFDPGPSVCFPAKAVGVGLEFIQSRG